MMRLLTFSFPISCSKDAEKYKIGADVHLTKPLLVDAKYELQGKVLVLPIKGKGDVHMEFGEWFDATNSRCLQ